MVIIGYSAYNQPKLASQTTVVGGAVESRHDYIDVRLRLRNNKDRDTAYNWEIILFNGTNERIHSHGRTIRGGTGIVGATSFTSPSEKENLRVGIKIYEEGELIEERTFYLNATELPIAW